MKNIKILTKGAGISFIGIILVTIFGYLFNVIIARYYGASQLGLYNIALAIITLLSPIALLGLNRGILRYLPIVIEENNKKKIRGILLFTFLVVISISFVLSICLYILSELIAISIFHNETLSLIIKLFSFILPFSSTMIILRNITLAYKNTKQKVLFEDVSQHIILILFALFSIILGFSIIGVVFGYMISVILVVIFYLTSIWKKTYLFDFKIRAQYISKELLNYSYPLLFASIILIAIKKTDILMIGYFRSSAEVGIYTIAIKTAMLLLIGLNSVNLIFGPMISSMHNKGQITELAGLYKTSTKWIFSISYPGLLIIILYSKEIMALFGKDFVVGYLVLIILGITQLINSATGSSGLIINMIGKSKVFLINQIVVFGINLSLNIILIPIYGIIGAAIATAIAIITVNLIRLAEVYYFLNIHPYKWTYLKPIGAGLIAFLIVKFIPFHWLLNLLIFSAIYIVIVVRLGLEKEEKEILNSIIRKFLPRINIH